MNWEYEIIFNIETENGHVLRVQPVKVLKSDSGEIVTQVDISALEFATSVPDDYIDSYFSNMSNKFKEELGFMFTYDPSNISSPTLGVSPLYAGNSFGYSISIVLEIGNLLVARKKGNLNV